MGSVSESVNASDGSVTAKQLYAPYGSVRSQSGTLPTDHGFTGQVSDAATSGLDDYGARYYDPVAGQFTSADSILPKQGATPDPSQLKPLCVCAARYAGRGVEGDVNGAQLVIGAGSGRAKAAQEERKRR